MHLSQNSEEKVGTEIHIYT